MKRILTAGLLAAALCLQACQSAPAPETSQDPVAAKTDAADTKTDPKNAEDKKNTEKKKESDKTDKDSSSKSDSDKQDSDFMTDPAPFIYSASSEFDAAIKNYPLLYKDGVLSFSNEPDQGCYVIPGLAVTATFLDGKKTECSDMVPQGVAIADDYVFISAYCKKHTCNSVVYMMDKESHEYLKTIPLEGRNHEGGLAFHKSTGMLWVATHEDKTASASSLSLSDLENYDYDSAAKPLKFSHTILTSSLSDDSFMTCHDDALYLGTFRLNGDSVIDKFDISKPGEISSTPDASYTISKWAQGIAFYKDYILISDSDGHSQSHLRVFKADDKNLVNGDEITDFVLPERLEQVAIDGNHAYLLFESAARAYEAADITRLDRIIQVDLSKAKL